MQGMVNSPELFKIYSHKAPVLFQIGANNDTYSAAFADDYILLVANTRAEVVRDKLAELFNKINKYYSLWNLRINAEKCETILFDIYQSQNGKKLKTSKYFYTQREK